MSPNNDEQFYEQVAAEFNNGTIKQGLWLKAETKARRIHQGEARLHYILNGELGNLLKG